MERYIRQIVLDEIGEEGQRKLASAKVLIVGVGGLGSVSSLYLAGAGIGTIGIMDADVVSVSNLQRQILYSSAEAGQAKVECAADRLLSLNPDIKVNVFPCRLDESNAADIISGYDVVVDGCDNFKTRFLISDTCAGLGIPYVYGGITAFSGQVAVLCTPGGKTFRDLCPDESVVSLKAQAGVVGMTPGVVGSVQALQTVKLLCGFGETLVDKLWIADFMTMKTDIISL